MVVFCLFVFSIGNFTSLAILSYFQTNMKVKFGLSRRKYFVSLFHEGFQNYFSCYCVITVSL